MEYCAAGTASELMEVSDADEDRPLPEAVIAVICLHTLRGLDYLHKARKIHRDIKGCNILLSEDGVAKLGETIPSLYRKKAKPNVFSHRALSVSLS